MSRAVFLDRDGTLIEDRNYLKHSRDVVFFSGVFEALASLSKVGFKLVMVTNQSGVGRGLFTMREVNEVHQFIERGLDACGVKLARIYVAPEAPDKPSRGRKPSPQFLFDARDQLGIDLRSSYMIGDKLIDLQCGQNAGVRRSILVRTGYGKKVEAELKDSDHLVVDDLAAAAEYIVKDGVA